MAEINVTKQDLQEAKQPDAVLVASRSAFDWLVEKKGLVLTVFAAVLVLVGGVSVVRARSQSADRAAGEKLAKALADKFKPVAGTPGARAEDKPFATAEARDTAVREALQALQSSNAGAPAARTAALVLAQQALDAGKPDDAIAALQSFQAGATGVGLDVLANEIIGYAHEAKKDWAAAEAAFAKLPAPARVAWHKARLLDLQGKRDEALKAFGSLVDTYPNDPIASEARVRIELAQMPPAGTGAFEAAAAAPAKTGK